jgi:pyruvate,water dikinase
VNARHLQILFEETGAMFGRNHVIRFVNGYAYNRTPAVDEGEVRRRIKRQEAVVTREAEEGGDYYSDVIEPEVLGMLERLGPFRRPADEELRSRLAFLDEAIEANGHVMGDLHWRTASANPAALDTPGFLRLFAELTDEPEANASILLQALDNKTTRLVRRLRGLARQVQGDAVLREIFAARDFERLGHAEVRSRPAVTRFRARFRRLLRDYGRRNGSSYGSSTTFTTPTWNLDHSAPLETIAMYAEQDLDELDRLGKVARHERRAKTRSIRRSLTGDDLAQFDEGLDVAHSGVLRMENHNAIMEQGVGGVLREAIWWMGTGLVREGALDDPFDAMHLSLDELHAHVAGDGGDLRALISERHAEYERRSRMRPPQIIGDGDRSKVTLPPTARDAEGLTQGLQGSVLAGTAASRGSYTGRARVVLSGAPISQIESGDILVARNAGQDITPVLSLLGAIVLDEGAIFQHAALVAREYRIPAVIETREATRVIADGQRIAVDGDTGTVDLSPT